MKVVPHFTTFQKAAVRLLAAVPSRQMFDAVLKQAHQVGVQKHRVRLVAMDGTGLESRHVVAISPSTRQTGILAATGPTRTFRRLSSRSTAKVT